ncbi:hypothetical protein [Caviibacter abscessus]|uniref:hypothetical protein n=1 Tax=Caviibacter abscessus TaxID=1766719 RepID=UPI000836D550|nr:hypothetical protein [Caviibacter abscessus]
MKKILIIIVIILVSIFSIIYFISIRENNQSYYDNIESAIVSYYTKDDDTYLKYFNKAYKMDKNNKLLFRIINSTLDEESAKKFYENKKDNNQGYEDLFYANLDYDGKAGEYLKKSVESGNEDASRRLFYEYYTKFEFENAINVLEKYKLQEDSEELKDIVNKKKEFLEVEHLYKKYKEGTITKSDRYILGVKLLTQLNYLFPKEIYDILKIFIEEKDNYALYSKYLILDSNTKEAKDILTYLLNKKFRLAILSDIEKNKNISYEYEKDDNEMKLAIANAAYQKDMWDISTKLYNELTDYKPSYFYVAHMYYDKGALEKAYEEYKKSYLYNKTSDQTLDKLIGLSQILNKEDILEFTDDFNGNNNEKRQLLKYKKADLKNKKAVALEMWNINKKVACNLLLELSNKKEKEKIQFYTNVIKQDN